MEYGAAQVRKYGELFRLFCVDAGDRSARDFQNGFVGAANQEAGVTHLGDFADDTAGGDHSIACFQLRDGGLQLFLLSLLWPDQQQIEHTEYENHREEEPESTRPALEQK